MIRNDIIQHEVGKFAAVQARRDEAREARESELDEDVRALKDAVAAISKRLDELFKSKADEAAREREEEDDDDPDRREGEPRQTAADSDDDDRRGRRDRRDRQDSTLRRQVADLERQLRNFRQERSDEDTDALALLQQEWDKVAMAHGERVTKPMYGESPTSYDRRNAKRFQRFSPRWQDVDLSDLPKNVLALATPEIRTDSLKAAYQPEQHTSPFLHEVKRRDRSGREISEFVGPVGAVNGALAPFRLPAQRVRINQPNNNQYYS